MIYINKDIKDLPDAIEFKKNKDNFAAYVCKGMTCQKPITNFSDCVSVFGEKVDYIIEGNIGENKKPSRIVDLLSKEILREGG